MIAVAIMAMGLTLYLTASGGLGRMFTALGTQVDGMVAGLTATPTPRPTVWLVPDAPAINRPDEPYTNQQNVDVVVALPPDVAGSDSVVRLRLGLPDAATPPAVVQEVPVGATDDLVIPGVPLNIGRNDFTATVRGPGGESEASAVVTYVLDLAKPPITLRSPVDGQTINGDVVTVTGTTQGRADIVARNGSTGDSVIARSDDKGPFSVEVPLGKGANTIGLTITDPAGNVATHLLTIVRGEGKLTAKLTTEPSGVGIGRLPAPMKLTVLVTDPDELPLEGAQVTFTLSIPGIQVVTSEGVTGADGTAVFETIVPEGANAGEAVAAVLVRTDAHGDTTASVEVRLAE